MNLRPHIALDIGTAYTKGANGQTQTTCPTAVLQDLRQQQTIAVGGQALEASLQPGQELIRPVTEGVMTHYDAGQALITHTMGQLLPWWTLLRPTVVLSKSQLARPAQLQQVRQATRLAGGGSVFAADVTALAALGAGIQPEDPAAVLVVDIGAGTTEAAVIVRGTPVIQSVKPVGGHSFITALRDYCQQKWQVDLSAKRAELLLQEIGSATEVSSAESVLVQEGGELEMTTNNTAQAINSSLEEITDLIRTVMRDSSAALLSDVAEQGIVLTGGVAQLDNLATRLSRRLSVPTAVADKPKTAVVRGAQKAQQFIGTYQESAVRNNMLSKQEQL